VPTVKRIAVDFGTGLPNGTCATFKHDGELWIAYPQSKNKRILAAVDRIIGITDRIEKDMIRWINKWPEDGSRVAEVMILVARIHALKNDLAVNKIEAQTQ